jgi:SRSO17 transposase
MDTASLGSLLPELDRHLARFGDCFSRREQRESLRVYVRGQLSDLERKSVEPIALEFGVPPRNVQQFLSQAGWDHEMVRARTMQIIREDYDDPDSVGLIDETYHAKKGDKTPGVQRQWCGTKGTTDNCTVTVHLSLAAGETRCMVDSELFLPEESWANNRERCRAAGIPDEVVYRPKWQIALELLDRARANGVRFGWFTFDAGYGMHSDFLTALDARGALYVGEVPGHLPGWTKAPPVMLLEHAARHRTGHPRAFPRVKVLPGNMHKAKAVDSLTVRSPVFRDQEWTTFHVKDDSQGPVVWEAKEAPFHLRSGGRHVGTPTWAHRLIIARHALTKETKYFVSNAPRTVPLARLLEVAFTRWAVERTFEDAKGELGLSHFEVRTHTSLVRHLILTAVSFLFLSRSLARRRGKKPAPDDLPGPACRVASDPAGVGSRPQLA